MGVTQQADLADPRLVQRRLDRRADRTHDPAEQRPGLEPGHGAGHWALRSLYQPRMPLRSASSCEPASSFITPRAVIKLQSRGPAAGSASTEIVPGRPPARPAI